MQLYWLKMSGNCGKGFLYIYNLIFLGIAGVLIYLSVLFVMQWGDYSMLVANVYTIIPSGGIFIFSIFIMITAIIGLCGACKENRCILGVFFTMLLIMVAVEVGAGTLTYLKREEIEVDIKDNLWKSFNNYESDASRKQAFDKMQSQLHCCGVQGAKDWHNHSYTIPSSCCRHQMSNCYMFPLNVFQQGCYDKMMQVLNKNLKYITGVVIGFAILQVLGMMIGMYLIVVFKKTAYMRLITTQAA